MIRVCTGALCPFLIKDFSTAILKLLLLLVQPLLYNDGHKKQVKKFTLNIFAGVKSFGSLSLEA